MAPPSRSRNRRYSSRGRPRPFFVCPRSAFSVSRRSFDPSVGRLAFRRFGTISACATNSSRRARAAARLPSCVRCSLAVITSIPSCVNRLPASTRSRARTASGKVGDRSTSKRNSTAVDTLFTFCPPGPEARTNVSVNSELGIRIATVLSA